MTLRYRVLLAAVLLSALFLGDPGRAAAGPIYRVTVGDTSSLAGTTGSLEFQYTQDPINPVAASASVFNVQGATLIAPSPSAIFSGSPTGTLFPPGSLILPNVDGSNQPTDVFQDITFGKTLSFDVSFDGPGFFYFSAWNVSAADLLNGAPAMQLFSSTDLSGAAVVLGVDANGVATVFAIGPGVDVAPVPEPTSLALFGLGGAALGAWRWRRRRAA